MTRRRAADGPREAPLALEVPLVRQLLAGKMTLIHRRVDLRKVTFAPNVIRYDAHGDCEDGRPGWFAEDVSEAFMDTPAECMDSARIRCPYRVDDHLWVREKWAPHCLDDSDPPGRIVFAADGANYECGKAFNGRPPKRGPKHLDSPDWTVARWRSSTSLPRWACRIVLHITSVSAMRLQDTMVSDVAKAGLIERYVTAGWDAAKRLPVFALDGTAHMSEASLLCAAWNRSPDGKRHPWSTNPWIWRVGIGVLTRG